MKDFLQLVRDFVLPYRKRIYLNLVFNLLSALFSSLALFMFIPVLRLLFGMEDSPLPPEPTHFSFVNISRFFAGWAAEIQTGIGGILYYLIPLFVTGGLFVLCRKIKQVNILYRMLFRVSYYLLCGVVFIWIWSFFSYLFVTDTASYLPINISVDNLKANFYGFINGQIATHGAFYTLLFISLTLLFFVFSKSLCAFMSEYVLAPLRNGVTKDIRIRLYDKITGLPVGYLTNERKGDIIARMMNDVQEVENSIVNSINMFIKNPIIIIITIGAMLFLSWKFTLFAFVMLPIAGYFVGTIGKSLKKPARAARDEIGHILTNTEETLGGLKVLKVFGAERMFRSIFKRHNMRYFHINNGVNRRYALAHPVSEFLGTSIIVCLVLFGGYLVMNDTSPLNAAEFLTYLTFFYQIINPAKAFSSSFYSIQKGRAALDRINEILEVENTMKNPTNPRPVVFEQEIEFRNVKFSYDNWDVLKGINLKVKKGQMIALVGSSGSGKTTMVDLIPRFYDVTDGQILIDGVDIREFDMKELRSLLGYVNQESILFNESFHNNIVLGTLNATKEQVEQAAKVAHAHDFIMETENQYATSVGERGNKLSGGQRQRICIARAVLKNPDILIFDEATSALDAESERHVQEALEALMQNRTSFVVAHRLSTIRNADLICVMDQGKIIEMGTHDTLMQQKGAYTQLNEMQLM